MRFFRTCLLSIILIASLCYSVKAQQKTMSFKAGYTIGYTLDHGKLAVGSQLQINDIHGEESFLGKVISSSPCVVAQGAKTFFEDNSEVKIQQSGTFDVSNQPDGTLVFNSKKGGEIIISVTREDSTVFETDTKRVSFTSPRNGFRTMTILWKYAGTVPLDKKKSLSVKISNSLIEQYGFSNIDALQENTLSGYEIVWNDGATFKGNVRCHNEGDNSFYHYELGTWEDESFIRTLTASEGPGDYTYTVEALNPEESAIYKSEVVIPASIVTDYGYWKNSAYVHNGVFGKFWRTDGVSFEGKYDAPMKNGAITSIVWLDGTYTWPSGDKFVGDLTGQWLYGIPLNGILTLANGKVLQGEWWKGKVFQLTEEEWVEFEKGTTPSQKILYAYQATAVRTINGIIPKLNDLMAKGKNEEALALIREYKDYAAITEIAGKWSELETSLVENLLHGAAINISKALQNRDYSKAIELAIKFNGYKVPVSGQKSYEGSLKFENYLYRPMNVYAYWTESGAAYYEYNQQNGGRVRQGQYLFSNDWTTYHGYFNNGEMDGAFVCDINELKTHTVSIQSYKNGAPDGIFVRIEKSATGDLTLLQYCIFANGRVASDMWFNSARVRFENGNVSDDVVAYKNERGVTYQYVYHIKRGNVISVEKVDESLGTKTWVYPGERLEDIPKPYMLTGTMYGGMLRGVILPSPVFD